MTATLTYRKTRQGEWVVFGPRAAMWDDLYNKHLGSVTVTKKDGTAKTERLARLSKPFTADGAECCYGYIDKAASAPRTRKVRAYGHDFTEYAGGFDRDGN